MSTSMLGCTLRLWKYGLVQFTEAVVNLKFDEEPKYEAYISLFEGLCGPRSQRPIQTLNVVAKVGTKRPRDPNDEIFLDSTGAPKKKVRFDRPNSIT